MENQSFIWFKDILENKDFKFLDSKLEYNELVYEDNGRKYELKFNSSIEMKNHLIKIVRSKKIGDLGI